MCICTYLKQHTQFKQFNFDEKTQENEKTVQSIPLKHTFDPIYYPLDEYKNYFDFRRPEIEQLEAELKLDKIDVHKRKKSTFQKWFAYHADSLPTRKKFEDAINLFIDENYLISSELKRNMKEIDKLVERLEIGVEMTEESNFKNNELNLASSKLELEDDSRMIGCSAFDELNELNAEQEEEEQQNKTIAPFMHKKYMKEDDLIPLPWMTKKIQAYPFLPLNHQYIVRHVFGLTLDDTICRCVSFEDEDDFKSLHYEYNYLNKIEALRTQYSSEELDLLLNYNCKLDDNQVPIIDLFNPKLDLTKFDFSEFEKQLNLRRLKIQQEIKSKPKLKIKDYSKEVPELGDSRAHSKSFVKEFFKQHSISKIIIYYFFLQSSSTNLVYHNTLSHSH